MKMHCGRIVEKVWVNRVGKYGEILENGVGTLGGHLSINGRRLGKFIGIFFRKLGCKLGQI